MNNLISVIIPVYNCQNVLPECVQSVLAQTYDNIEIILIDDGSTDGTLACCRALAQKDSRIHVIAAAHGGVSAARNRGLEAVNGDYIFFIDSDDVIHPQLLASLYSGLKHSKAQIAGSGIVNVSERNWHLVKEKNGIQYGTW